MVIAGGRQFCRHLCRPKALTSVPPQSVRTVAAGAASRTARRAVEKSRNRQLSASCSLKRESALTSVDEFTHCGRLRTIWQRPAPAQSPPVAAVFVVRAVCSIDNISLASRSSGPTMNEKLEQNTTIAQAHVSSEPSVQVVSLRQLHSRGRRHRHDRRDDS